MKLISCNIEGDKHFSRLIPFFQKEQPDVLCLQEVFESDLELIKEKTGLTKCFFAPQANIILSNDHLPLRGIWGVAIFAKKIVKKKVFYYFGHKNGQVNVFENAHPDKIDRALIIAQIEVAGQLYQVATLHFTWSSNGDVIDVQKRDYLSLKSFLAKCDELILCGDFNTPRGGEIWADLAKKYTDNIPSEIETTIDKNLHKSGKDIRLVIDALFTSSHYVAGKVRVVSSTSDHMAVVGELARVD